MVASFEGFVKVVFFHVWGKAAQWVVDSVAEEGFHSWPVGMVAEEGCQRLGGPEFQAERGCQVGLGCDETV